MPDTPDTNKAESPPPAEAIVLSAALFVSRQFAFAADGLNVVTVAGAALIVTGSDNEPPNVDVADVLTSNPPAVEPEF
jgi:hypothetical protein